MALAISWPVSYQVTLMFWAQRRLGIPGGGFWAAM